MDIESRLAVASYWLTIPAMDIESCLAVVSSCAFLAMDIESCLADAYLIPKSTDVAGTLLTLMRTYVLFTGVSVLISSGGGAAIPDVSLLPPYE